MVCKPFKNSLFQSTPSAWRETFCPIVKLNQDSISIHSLRMEGDPFCSAAYAADKPFQSTPSAWRETPVNVLPNPISWYFNPLPPHGGRQYTRVVIPRSRRISIHSLRMEGDRLSRNSFAFTSIFQSTPSAWRETEFGEGIAHVATDFNPLPPHGGRPQRTGNQRQTS